MKIELFTYSCIGCGKCVKRCPTDVLTLADNGMCQFVEIKNEDLCVGCKKCEHICPNNAIRIQKHQNNFLNLQDMKTKSKIVFSIISKMVIIALIVAVIMWLWNLIIPAITNWNNINYWQALGLAVLSRLLTGHLGIPLPKHHNDKTKHFHDMSTEQRKAFIREKIKKLSNEVEGGEQ